MNISQKTRLLQLEFQNAGLSQNEATVAARLSADTWTWPTDGSPPVGIAGQSVGEFAAWFRGQNGAAPAPQDNPKNNDGGGAVELTVAQRAAADCGLSDAEFASKDPAFRMSAFDRVQGDTVTPAWRVGAKPRPFAGLSAAEISKMTPEEKLAAADADLFARGRQS
jgi:hypothetical protein